ncbi:T9SS type A sorting domain-containing protein [bacterium]|nr:T9SS type A sorting domain-containing protein [bacterium]
MKAAWVVILLLPVLAQAQPDMLWSRLYSTESIQNAQDLIQTEDGGYFIAGMAFSSQSNTRDMYCVRTNSIGDTLWTRLLGLSADDWAHAAASLPDGEFALAGFTGDYLNGEGDVWLVSLAENGDSLRSRQYDLGALERCSAVLALEEGGFILAGGIEYTNPSNTDALLIRTNSSGDTLWTRIIGGPETGEWCRDIVRVGDNFLLGGFQESAARGFWIALVASTGEVLWQETYDSGHSDDAAAVGVLSDGNYFLSGESIEFGELNEGWSRTLKLSSDPNNWGAVIWDTQFSSAPLFRLGDALAMPDGGVAITGHAGDGSGGNHHVVIYRLDSDGNVDWTLTLGHDNLAESNAITLCSDGGLAVAATPYSQMTGPDILLMRFEPEISGTLARGENLLPNLSLVVYPNPFNPSTNISFSLQDDGRVRLAIYNALGVQVAELLDGRLHAGEHSLVFDGSNWSSGVYFALLETRDVIRTTRLALVR